MSAPDVTMPQSPSSVLGGAIPPAAPQMPQYDPSQEQQTDTDLSGPQKASSGGSRLAAVLSAVANVASTGLSGIPDKGRPSAISGLGEGARAEQAAQATQQAIKMKSFDDSVRLANLHNQDLELQQRTQAQQDAHQKAQDEQRDWDNDHGIDYDTVANNSDAVMNHLTAQTDANGSAAIPTGTHLSADGNSVNIPTDTQATRDGLMQKYNLLAPVYGIPSLSEGAKFVPPRMNDMLTHAQQGYGLDGHPINHDALPGAIASLQTQRDALAKKGATPDQLTAVDNTLGIMKANLKALDDHAAGVAQQTAQSKKAGEVAAETSPAAIKAAADKAGAVAQAEQPYKIALQDNSAANRPQKTDTNMYVGTDANGNQIAGTAGDLQSAGAQGVTKLDADTGKKVITARQLVSPSGLFAQIKQDMLNLDAKGKMGSSATARLNDALLQKAGADADYAPLFVHTHLLSTALMQAHVGSRGSSDMMEEFQKLANSGKMNAATLRSSLGAEYNYVKEKAMLPKAQATSSNGGQ